MKRGVKSFLKSGSVPLGWLPLDKSEKEAYRSTKERDYLGKDHGDDLERQRKRLLGIALDLAADADDSDTFAGLGQLDEREVELDEDSFEEEASSRVVSTSKPDDAGFYGVPLSEQRRLAKIGLQMILDASKKDGVPLRERGILPYRDTKGSRHEWRVSDEEYLSVQANLPRDRRSSRQKSTIAQENTSQYGKRRRVRSTDPSGANE